MSNRKPKPRLLRQKRITMRSPHCHVEISGLRYRVNNLSRFGVAVESKSPFGSDNEILTMSLYYSDTLIGEYKALIVREQEVKEGEYEVAFEVLDQPVNLEKVEAMVLAHETIERHYRLQKSYNQLPSEYRKISRQMLDSIYLLSHLMAESMANIDSDLNLKLEEFEDDVRNSLSAYLESMVNHYLEHIEKALEKVDEKLLQLAMDYLMQRLEPLVGHHRQLHQQLHDEDASVIPMENIYRDRRRSRLFSETLYQVLIREPEESARKERLEILKFYLFSNYVRSKSEAVRVLLAPAFKYEDLIQLLQQWPEISDGQFEFYFFDNSRRRFLEAHEQLHMMKRQRANNFHFRFIHEGENSLESDKFRHSFDLVIYYSAVFKVFPMDRKDLLDLAVSLCSRNGHVVLFAPNVEGANRIRKYLSYGAGMPLTHSKDLEALLLDHSTSWIKNHEAGSWNLCYAWRPRRSKSGKRR